MSLQPSDTTPYTAEELAALRTTATTELANLMAVLPSDYISRVMGPNYTLFMLLYAEEYAKIRDEATKVEGDAVWSSARFEFLYQNLGHRLHDIDARHSFFPPVDYDGEYREFLINLQNSLLAGATAEALKTAGSAATNLTADVVELFEFIQTDPTQPAGNYDASDRNSWRYTVDVSSSPISLELLYKGFLFAGGLAKPAHSTFTVQLQNPSELDLQHDAGCYWELGPTGYLMAGFVTKSRPKAPDEEYDVGVVNGRHIRGVVTSAPAAGSFTMYNNVEIRYDGDTIFSDIDGIYTLITEIQVGDVVEVEGFVEDIPLDSEGYPIATKIHPTSHCVRSKWRLEQYDYIHTRDCPANWAELREVIDEIVAPTSWGTEEFYVRMLPIATEDGEVCFHSPNLASNPVQVVHDDLMGTITPLLVLYVNPYTGRVLLDGPPPIGGEIRATYHYWDRQPVVGMHYDVDGLDLDMHEDCAPFYTVLDEIPEEEVDDFNYYYDYNASAVVVTTEEVPVFCQDIVLLEDEANYHVRYTGFQHAHSSCLDTPNMNYDFVEGPRNRLDDYHVVDSRHWSVVDAETSPSDAFQVLMEDQEQLLGTVLVPWTQDFENGLNRVFSREVILVSLSDLLNNATSLLNTDTLELNAAETETQRKYVQDLYTCLIAWTNFLYPDDPCTPRSRTRVCDHGWYFRPYDEEAGVITVGDGMDFPTLPPAIAAAPPYTILEVYPGSLYNNMGPMVITQDGLTIRTMGGPADATKFTGNFLFDLRAAVATFFQGCWFDGFDLGLLTPVALTLAATNVQFESCKFSDQIGQGHFILSLFPDAVPTIISTIMRAETPLLSLVKAEAPNLYNSILDGTTIAQLGIDKVLPALGTVFNTVVANCAIADFPPATWASAGNNASSDPSAPGLGSYSGIILLDHFRDNTYTPKAGSALRWAGNVNPFGREDFFGDDFDIRLPIGAASPAFRR